MVQPDPLSHSAAPAAAPVSTARAYAQFTFGTGLWFGGWGMLQVLFSWLVVGELRAREELVGVAQLALVLPTLLFLLLGGAVADRLDRRHLLVALHAAAGGFAIALGTLVWMGALTFWLVLAFALAMGTISAFYFPARDALLADVAGGNLMRAVTGVTLTQFVGQGVGQLVAGSARYLGSPSALLLEGGLFLLGALGFGRISSDLLTRSRQRVPLRAGELLAGLSEVVRSPVLRPIWLLRIAVGLFFAGPYFVVFPLLNHEYYGGDVADLSLIYLTFPAGSVLGLILLWRRGYVRRRGRAIVIAQSGAALTLLAISTGIPYGLALVAGTVWGVCGAFFISLGRTVFQEQASDAQRARVMSIEALGVMGAGTVGSPLAGLLAAQLGATGAFAFCGVAMLVFAALVGRFTDVWRH